MYNKHLSRNQQFVSKGNEKHDDPQGAESSDHYKENYSTPAFKITIVISQKVMSPKKSTGNLDQHPHP